MTQTARHPHATERAVPRRTLSPVGQFVALAISLALAGEAAAQRVVDIPRQPGCRGCTIEVQRVAVLGEADGPGIIESEFTMGVADSRGRYFLYHAYAPEVKAYDANGRFIKRLGGTGRGPGEFNGVGVVRVTAGDTVHLFDGNNLTHSVFSPALQFVRSTALEIMPQIHAVPLGGDRVVLGVALRSPSRVGLPLHLVEGGRVVRSFGSVRGAYRPDIPYIDSRTIAPADQRSVWAAQPNRYVIEQWSTEGQKLRELRRSVGWFPPVLTNWLVSPSKPPPTLLQQVWQDRAGRLWVSIMVPDRNWRSQVRRGGPHGYTVADNTRYYDTIIEVIDPRRGVLLASRRFNEWVHFMGEDRIGAVVGEDDVPQYVVWRVQLASPTRRSQ
jgi:hypothetical protein